MTLRTITFDDSIYKLVPLEPTEEMITAKPKPAGIEGQCVQTQKRNADIRKYQAMVAAAPEVESLEMPEDLQLDWKGVDGAIAYHLIDRHADNWGDVGRMMNAWMKANQSEPEYQEPEQLCDDGGKCGAGGYCNNCAEPVVKENGKLRERLANQHAKIEQLEADNEVLRKQAERYEKVRKLDARQLAEIFRMNIQEGIPFDELIDGICIFTALDIAEAEKEGEKMWQALCEDDGGKCGAGGYCKDCIQDTTKDEL